MRIRRGWGLWRGELLAVDQNERKQIFFLKNENFWKEERKDMVATMLSIEGIYSFIRSVPDIYYFVKSMRYFIGPCRQTDRQNRTDQIR